MRLSEQRVAKIEENLKLHINYNGTPSGGKYTREMDKLTYDYLGPKGLALSDMLDDYFKQVGVSNLDEALNRLKQQDHKPEHHIGDHSNMED